MSVVLVQYRSSVSIRRTVDALLSQTIRGRLELILVVPAGGGQAVSSEELDRFACGRIVEVDDTETPGLARATGVRAARSPIVAFTEDHAYPEPEWAAKILDAFKGPWAGIAPALLNANPDSALSWASLFLDFRGAVHPRGGGERTDLPWHNSCYRRELLLSLGAELDSKLAVEGLVMSELRKRGGRFFLESTARSIHLNVSSLSGLVKSEFYGGRWFAARRGAELHWSAGERWMRAAAAPIVALVGVCRTVGCVLGSSESQRLPRILPALLFGHVVYAAGEAVGYMRGAGDAPAQKSEVEFDRMRFVRVADR